MTKIYQLASSYGDICFFIEDCPEEQDSILNIAMDREWQPFEDYNPITLELHRSDTGKKNYQFDFSGSLNPFLVFSEKAQKALEPILAPRGQFLEVITDSKRKKFIGYYPTNVYPKGILDLEHSDYIEYPNGLLVRKAVLIKEKIPDEYLFTIEEDTSIVFVTEKFKQLVEEHELIGFKFSDYNEIVVR
ncbi:imm11 family protein [Pasteurella sp. PK-2025]|uniref:imm11 family protein n=1 Tax=unclassified Pasteurella TaxID=2621516 RepID=UPI003C756770